MPKVLLSLRAYAKYRGVNLSAVQRAIKDQRISTVKDEKGNGKIDPVTADVEWSMNTDHSYNHSKKTPEVDPEDFNTLDDDDDHKPPNFQNAKAIGERYKARMAKLNFEQKVGKLVDIEKVRKEAFDVAKLTRDTLLNIPNKICHELAAESDPGKVYQVLTEAITQGLETLAAQGLST